MRIVPCDRGGIAATVAVLRAGEIAAYPTETVYGLGVNPFLQDAAEKLVNAKGRLEGSAMLLIVADDNQLRQAVTFISPQAKAFMEAFWPGPLSLLFPKSPKLAPLVTGPFEKVCVRCPAHPVARALCKAADMPITSTSANVTGERPAVRVQDIHVPGVVVALDGGELPPSPPSTVYDPDTDTIVRQGVITRAQLDEVVARLKTR